MIDNKSFCTLTYGLYLVSSTNGEGKINGLIANSVFQVTAEPTRIAVTVNKDSLTHTYIEESGRICVQPLSEKATLMFIGNFGFKTGREVNKFENIKYTLSTFGLPIVKGDLISYFLLKVEKKIDLDTHTMFICNVEGAEFLDKETPPMSYDYYHKFLRGKTPKGATTYQKEEKPKGGKDMKYVCNVCGYVYDETLGDPDHGIVAGTKWEDVPETWVCPVCGVAKDQFTQEA